MRNVPSFLIATVVCLLRTDSLYGQSKKRLFARQKYCRADKDSKLELNVRLTQNPITVMMYLVAPERRAGLRAYLKKLGSLKSAKWWAASTEDLTACYWRTNPAF